MADDKKSGGDPREQKKEPIDPKKVVVKVLPNETPTPRNANRKDAHRIATDNADKQRRADKATGDDSGGATKEVREAIKEAAPKGRDAQEKAAEKAAADVGKKLDPKVFGGVKVDIPGTAPIVAPATEGAPPASAPAEKKGT